MRRLKNLYLSETILSISILFISILPVIGNIKLLLLFIIPITLFALILYSKTKINYWPLETNNNSEYLKLSLIIYSLIFNSLFNSSLLILFDINSLIIFFLSYIIIYSYLLFISETKLNIKYIYNTLIFLLFIPVFFSYENGLYLRNAWDVMLENNGVLDTPFPISIFCIMLILPILREYLFNKKIMIFISLLYISFYANFLFVPFNDVTFQEVMINNIQYFIPTLGLLIGFDYFKKENINLGKTIIILFSFYMLIAVFL